MRMKYLLNHVDTRINRTAKNDHFDEASVTSVDGLLSVSSSSIASKMRRYTWTLNGVHRTFMGRYIIWIFTFFVLVQFGTAYDMTSQKVKTPKVPLAIRRKQIDEENQHTSRRYLDNSCAYPNDGACDVPHADASRLVQGDQGLRRRARLAPLLLPTPRLLLLLSLLLLLLLLLLAQGVLAH